MRTTVTLDDTLTRETAVNWGRHLLFAVFRSLPRRYAGLRTDVE